MAATQHLLDVDGLSWPELQRRLAVAEQMRAIRLSQAGRVNDLRDQSVAMLFYEASTRTRLSFVEAAHALGAHLIDFDVSSSSVGKGESLADTVRTLGALGATTIVLVHHGSLHRRSVGMC